MKHLGGPKPSPAQCQYRGSFRYSDADACQIKHSLTARVRLGADSLWVSSELSIPVAAVRNLDIVRRDGRCALSIMFENPITGALESIFLCSRSLLGGYRLRPLLELKERLERAMIASTVPAARAKASHAR